MFDQVSSHVRGGVCCVCVGVCVCVCVFASLLCVCVCVCVCAECMCRSQCVQCAWCVCVCVCVVCVYARVRCVCSVCVCVCAVFQGRVWRGQSVCGQTPTRTNAPSDLGSAAVPLSPCAQGRIFLEKTPKRGSAATEAEDQVRSRSDRTGEPGKSAPAQGDITA